MLTMSVFASVAKRSKPGSQRRSSSSLGPFVTPLPGPPLIILSREVTCIYLNGLGEQILDEKKDPREQRGGPRTADAPVGEQPAQRDRPHVEKGFPGSDLFFLYFSTPPLPQHFSSWKLQPVGILGGCAERRAAQRVPGLL